MGRLLPVPHPTAIDANCERPEERDVCRPCRDTPAAELAEYGLVS